MKKILFYFLLFSITLVSCTCGGHYYENYGQPVYVFPGIGLGTIIAVVVSWSRNQSILWAIIHGILSWFYVIYAILVPKKD